MGTGRFAPVRSRSHTIRNQQEAVVVCKSRALPGSYAIMHVPNAPRRHETQSKPKVRRSKASSRASFLRAWA
eukprot:5191387-Alexandrium_andersonii.AAC.1